MKITSAVFDIGNVLLPFDYYRAANRLIAQNQPPRPPDREKIVAIKNELEFGRIDRAEFLRLVLPEFAHTGPEENFVSIWEDIFVPNEPLFELVEELSTRMPLYLLSNTNVIHREAIHRDYPVFRHFKDAVYSYEVGLMKPDPAIFELAAKQFGINPAETLYLDDMPENVESAIACGFVTIHYNHLDHESALRQIRDLIK